MDRIIIHVDFDYFYAQCEETRKSSLRAAPLVVCVFSGRGSDSGAVATANYAARKYNVKSGISIKLARHRLANVADAQFLPVDFEFYEAISKRAMNIMREHAEIFEYVSRDEAYLDITSMSSTNYKTASHIAQQIKNEIRKTLSLTCSIGISPNKLVSKIASDYQKPDGLTIVEPDKIKDFLDPLKIRDIPGLGKKTEESLMNLGFKTVADLRNCNVFTLIENFGRNTGTYLYRASKGIDDSIVAERGSNLQYSKIATLEHDSIDATFIEKSLPELCSKVHVAVLKDSRTFRTVGIHFIRSDMVTQSRSFTLRNPTSSLDELKRVANTLLHEALESQNILVRRVGVKVSELGDAKGQRNMDDYS